MFNPTGLTYGELLEKARQNSLSSHQCGREIVKPGYGTDNRAYWLFLSREDKKKSFDQWVKEQGDK